MLCLTIFTSRSNGFISKFKSAILNPQRYQYAEAKRKSKSKLSSTIQQTPEIVSNNYGYFESLGLLPELVDGLSSQGLIYKAI